ncbi:MAG TPA: cupredoxin family copper-binding protein [Thermoleophilaceae bacterium]|nr:cupredoxin family copper-binding protein [Thermoleophilaceae bacterium]
MRHVALLVAVYALTAALVLPGTLLAQESEQPAPTETTATEQAAPEPAPAAAPAPAPEPALAPEPAPPAPEPQILADEREAAPQPRPKPTALAAASGSVTIVDFNFSPGTITVDVGDTVTWVNNGPTPHSATSSSGAFDTGIFPAGESRSHTFNEAGTFSYICTPHPNMRGTVVVQGAQTGDDTPDSSGGSDDSAGSGATGEAAQSDGPTLPNSGADAGALLSLGALLLLLGVAVHRRVRTG